MIFIAALLLATIATTHRLPARVNVKPPNDSDSENISIKKIDALIDTLTCSNTDTDISLLLNGNLSDHSMVWTDGNNNPIIDYLDFEDGYEKALASVFSDELMASINDEQNSHWKILDKKEYKSNFPKEVIPAHIPPNRL